MAEGRPLTAFRLSLAGAILMFINVLSVGINGGPIIFSSYPVSSPEEIMNSTASFWTRITFGSRGWVEGLWVPFWLICATIILSCSIMLYFRPIRRKMMGFLIVLFSILSIPYGGGFILGLILGVAGGAIGFEWPTPVRETFFGRMVRAARLDSTLYQNLNQDRRALKHAAYIIILVSILSGLGNGVYSFNAQKILNSESLNVAFRVLLLGETYLDISVLTPAIAYISVAILKWITLSIILYVVGVWLAGGNASFEEIGVAASFAYVPVCLQLFMPFVFVSKPYLTFTWPFAVVLVTNVWMIIALVVAIKQTLEMNLSKIVGVIALAGAFYLWLNQTFLMTLDIPYRIQVSLGPEPIFLLLISGLVVLATLFGVFSRQK